MREEASVVGGHAPTGVARIDRPPQLPHVVPEVGGLLVVVGVPGAAVVGQSSRQAFQGVVGVMAVGAVRQQVLVLGICHEQQPEQDHHDLLVGVVQLALAGLTAQPSGDRLRQSGHRLEVDPLPQPHCQVAGEVR